MTTTIPPAHKIATPGMEVATLGALWRLSDETGVAAGAILRAFDQLEGADAEGGSEVRKD